MTRSHRWAAVAASVLALSAIVWAQAPAPSKKLLFLTHAGLYKHTSLGPAEKAVTELGKSAASRS